MVLPHKFDDFRRRDRHAAQVVLFERRFGGIHGTDHEFREPHRPRGQRHGCQELLEMREHARIIKAANP